MGDVHPLGNPHYWLDPGNGRSIAQAISRQAERAVARPTRRTSTQRYADFDKRLAAAREALGRDAWRRTRATKIVTYHRSWPNFMERFGLDVDRLRRAEAGHSAVAVAHARAHRRDEAPGRQADRRRAVLRPEDAAGDRDAGRRQGAGAGAVGRRHEGSDRLHSAVRVRRQHAGGGAQADRPESRPIWIGRSSSFSRRRSSRA